MTTSQLYRWNHQGAPGGGAAYNSPGFTILLLDACLVNGFGSVTVSSITRTGSVATVTTVTPHGLDTLSVAAIAGAVETDYNGSFVVQTAPSSTVYTYTVPGSPTTPATGSISSKRAPAGWAKAFTGTNLASYRAAVGNRFYFNVDDGTTSQHSRFRGFEVATAAGVAVASGTNPFPTDLQVSGGGGLHHLSPAATGWWIVASDRFFILVMSHGAPPGALTCIFGDFTSYKTSDAFGTVLICRSAYSNTGDSDDALKTNVAGNGAMDNNSYLVRNYAGSPGSVACQRGQDSWRSNQSTVCGVGPAAYSQTEGGVVLSPYWLAEGVNGVRGHLTGLWAPLGTRLPTQEVVFVGASGTALAGKTFLYLYNAGTGSLCLEISPTTWV